MARRTSSPLRFDEDKRRVRLDWSIVIPLVTAIVAGLIGFVSSAYVSYTNNETSLTLEREKFKLNIELERQKFKTNLIIEAVKTGDKSKALDNLNFFLEAGFIDVFLRY